MKINVLFKIIESDQSCNIVRDNVSWKRIKHIRYQQLSCSTNPDGKHLEDENFIVKSTF